MRNGRWIRGACAAGLLVAAAVPAQPREANAQQPRLPKSSAVRPAVRPALDPAPRVRSWAPRDSAHPGQLLSVRGGPFRVPDLRLELVTSHGRIRIPAVPGSNETSLGFRITDEMYTGPGGARLVLRHDASSRGNASEERVLHDRFKVVDFFVNPRPPAAADVPFRADGDDLWGARVVPFLTVVPATCARGGVSAGVFVGRSVAVVGTPLVNRFGLVCDPPAGSDYYVEHGDRNSPAPIVRCPSGYHLTGIRGRAGLAIDRISSIRCTRMRRDGTAEHRTVSVDRGGSGGQPKEALCADPRRFLTARIYKNVAIDMLEWSCAFSSR